MASQIMNALSKRDFFLVKNAEKLLVSFGFQQEIRILQMSNSKQILIQD